MQKKRDKQGRFQVGNPGGPGRPKRQTETAYMQAMMDEVPLETWREVVRSAVDAAKAGDHQARAWLAKYLVGEPQTTAPSPMQVIVEQLLQVDRALERAAERLASPILGRTKLPMLHEDDDLQQAIEAEAAAAILAAESTAGTVDESS